MKPFEGGAFDGLNNGEGEGGNVAVLEQSNGMHAAGHPTTGTIGSTGTKTLDDNSSANVVPKSIEHPSSVVSLVSPLRVSAEQSSSTIPSSSSPAVVVNNEPDHGSQCEPCDASFEAKADKYPTLVSHTQVCSSSLSDWCEANGLDDFVSLAFADEGAKSFSDLSELSPTERTEVIDSMSLKVIVRKKVLRALSSDMMDLYCQCLDDGKSTSEYKHLSELARSSKSPTQEKGIEGKKPAEGMEDDSGLPSQQTTPKAYFPPGTHTVPHKIITLDREKAMRDNRLKANDFISLAKDIVEIPPDGEIKVCLFVGSTGSGKSTTINSYVNHLYGVQFDSTFRLKLVDEPPTSDRRTLSASQTHQVLGYLLEAPPALGGKHWLLIIDTPGFGDTRGLSYDLNTISEIRSFFNTEINYLHAVCFVVKGTETKLDTRNRWIFDQVLSLFGKDISEIITLLMTFSDAAEPPAMTVIDDAKIEYAERFKLNNSAFFLDGNSRSRNCDYDINEMFWKAGNRAFEEFSNFILGRKEKSLQETKTVLSRRDELKTGIENVRQYIELGMGTLEKLDQTVPEIIKLQTMIDTNKDFKFDVTVMEVRKKPKDTKYNTVCDNCNWTCHHDCKKNDNAKNKCCAMDSDSGFCKFCPNKCHWSDHKNLDYYYVRVPVKKKQTNKELYERYVSASSDKSKFDQVLEGLHTEFAETQTKVWEAVFSIQGMINELQEIALRPSLYHEDEYFDVMIECERKDRRAGWKQRIKMIEEVKQQSKLCSQVNSGVYDPFAERVAQLQQQARDGKMNIEIASRPVVRSPSRSQSAGSSQPKKKGFFGFSW